jgi:hypothetical protein
MIRIRVSNEVLVLLVDNCCVDKHRNPGCHARTVEWEGDAEHVAFRYLYMLLLGRPFVEIRHVETRLLLQIIHGNITVNTYCLREGWRESAHPQRQTSGTHLFMES